MSKFDKIFEARETATVEEEENGNQKPLIKKNVGRSKQKKEVEQTVLEVSEPTAQSSGRTDAKRGRPPAKRSDPDFVGLTTYIRRDTHTRAKITLLQEGEGRELSELVEDLIYSWLNKK